MSSHSQVLLFLSLHCTVPANVSVKIFLLEKDILFIFELAAVKIGNLQTHALTAHLQYTYSTPTVHLQYTYPCLDIYYR